jgi:carboxymethylenebutenolidase
MPHTQVQIDTPDGRCPTHVFHPDGPGPWPGVIVYMDAIGMRPAMEEIAERIANAGFFVLLPDLFYRVEFDASQGARIFSDPKAREDLMTRVMPSASSANVMRDTGAFLAYMDSRPEVDSTRIGVVGYCMGGRLALYAAGHFGDRIAAAASYHGGGLASDKPDSPHRLAHQMAARVYVGGAMEDANFDDAQKVRLEQALSDAGVDYVVETYRARHGWVPSDTPVHDEAEAERHWRTLLELFGRTLQGEVGAATP